VADLSALVAITAVRFWDLSDTRFFSKGIGSDGAAGVMAAPQSKAAKA
jgi:hypothetical protein